jgi:hypothetical protein
MKILNAGNLAFIFLMWDHLKMNIKREKILNQETLNGSSTVFVLSDFVLPCILFPHCLFTGRIANTGDSCSRQLIRGQHFSFTCLAGVYVLTIVIVNFCLLQPDSAVRSVTPSGKKVNIVLNRNSAQGSDKDHKF